MKLPFPLQPGEQIILVARRHWMAFVPRFVGYVLAALVPVVVAVVLLKAAGKLHGTALDIVLIVAVLWLLYWLFRIAVLQYRYSYDLWVVSDRRIIDLYRSSPFNFRMSTADLVEVEDISTSINGVFASLFDFGDIECQTAGEVRHFTFAEVSHPRQIAALIQEEATAAKGGERRPRAAGQEAPTERL